MNGQIDTTYEGWPIIQNQDPKNIASYGIGLLLLAGKFARISTDFFLGQSPRYIVTTE